MSKQIHLDQIDLPPTFHTNMLSLDWVSIVCVYIDEYFEAFGHLWPRLFLKDNFPAAAVEIKSDAKKMELPRN